MQRKTFLLQGIALISGGALSSSALLDSKREDDRMTSLSKGFLTFGIPGSAADNGWDGDSILIATITIHQGNSTYKAVQEHRNSPVGPGHAIYLILPFDQNAIKEMEAHKITEIDINVAAKSGAQNGGGPGQTGEVTRFRVEVVLEFSDGTKIATGYPDPAPAIITDNVPYSLQIFKRNFHGKPTLLEPIG